MGFVPHLLNFMGFCPTVLSTFHLRHAWMWMRDQLTLRKHEIKAALPRLFPERSHGKVRTRRSWKRPRLFAFMASGPS